MSIEALENLSLKAGKNLAPLKPLIALRDRRKEGIAHYLTDAIRERYNHYMRVDKPTWEDLIQVGHLTSLFIQGKQNLRWNQLTKTFYAVPLHKQQSEKLRVTPIMKFYETNSEARYMSSNPKVRVIAGREDDRCRQAAKGAETIVDYHEQKLYTNWHNRHDALLLMSFGTQVDQVRWNSSKKGWQAVRRIFEDREIPISEGVGQCFDCGHAGTGTEFLQADQSFAMCPRENCRSMNAYAEPPTTRLVPVETRREKMNLGAIELRQLEFPACRWDLRRRAEESSWFIYEMMTSLGAIQRLFGNVEIPEDKGGENGFGLDVVESLARAGAAVNGVTTTDEKVKSELYKEKVKLTEFYLSAEDMAGMKTGPDEQTVSGERLPANTPYAQIFPEGASCIGLSGFNVLLGLYPKTAHKYELTTGVWHQRQFSGAGQGVNDTVEINRRYNETDSQAYLAMKHNATPATVYAAGTVDKEYLQYLGNPDVAIPINLENLDGQVRSIQDIITSPRVGQIDAALIQFYSQNLQNMMQLTMQSTSFAGGLPGVNNKTATGAQIGDSNANMLFTPMVGIKVDGRVRKAEIFVELYREHVPVAQFFPLASRYGAQQGVWLSGSDLDADLLFTVVKNSELPKTQYSVRDDIDRFMFAVGGGQGFLMLKQAEPEFADELTRKYGVDFEVNHFDEVEQICRQRFEAARKMAKQFEQIERQVSALVGSLAPGGDISALPELFSADAGVPAALPPSNPTAAGPEPVNPAPGPAAAASQQNAPMMPAVSPARAAALRIVETIQNPVSMHEQNHLPKADWFSYFLDTDEGRSLDPVMREVVYCFIEAHFMMGGRRAALLAQMQGQVSQAGQLPGMVADTMKQQYLAETRPAPPLKNGRN